MGNPKGGPEHTRWKPGQSGNPSGKPKAAYSKDQIKARITNWMAEPVAVLEDRLKEGKLSGLDAMICAVIITAVKSGDFTRLNGLLDRTLGKVKDEIEQTIRNVTDEDLESIPQDALLKLISNA